ncbi:MAG TPA: hypothetical protein VKM55_19745 [Candidatus Lokiarchaeia archaeon]|nr:hypothetical protein [Candidatus Lokiarchaeia archaeon]
MKKINRIDYWASLLTDAPAPSRKMQAKPALRQFAAGSRRPDNRANSYLEKPEETINIPEPVTSNEEEDVSTLFYPILIKESG